MPRVGGIAQDDTVKHQPDGKVYLVDGSIIHGNDGNGNQLVWEHREEFPAHELSEKDFQRMRRDGFLKLREEFMTPEDLAAKQAEAAAEAARLASENADLKAQLEALLAERQQGGAKSGK